MISQVASELRSMYECQAMDGMFQRRLSERMASSSPGGKECSLSFTFLLRCSHGPRWAAHHEVD